MPFFRKTEMVSQCFCYMSFNLINAQNLGAELLNSHAAWHFLTNLQSKPPGPAVLFFLSLADFK